jgi:hypothetical protein
MTDGRVGLFSFARSASEGPATDAKRESEMTTEELPDSPVVVYSSPPVKQGEDAERQRLVSWYASDEFARLLLEAFNKARNAAIASNPPDTPG